MKINVRRAVVLGIVTIFLLAAAYWVGKLQTPHSVASTTAAAVTEDSHVARLFGPAANDIWHVAKSHKKEIKEVINIFFASIIGFAGALAFYVGVYFGLISPESRDDIIRYILSKRSVTLFSALGGVVAGVFQWAQAETLAPIQAFVLGATWPSVVTSIMAGSSTRPKPSAKEVVDNRAGVGGQPSKAEVMIPPPTTN